ncbi:hypothetical protein D3C79_1089660 [compost metagenome]
MEQIAVVRQTNVLGIGTASESAYRVNLIAFLEPCNRFADRFDFSGQFYSENRVSRFAQAQYDPHRNPV